jgi:hypothetical protein
MQHSSRQRSLLPSRPATSTEVSSPPAAEPQAALADLSQAQSQGQDQGQQRQQQQQQQQQQLTADGPSRRGDPSIKQGASKGKDCITWTIDVGSDDQVCLFRLLPASCCKLLPAGGLLYDS